MVIVLDDRWFNFRHKFVHHFLGKLLLSDNIVFKANAATGPRYLPKFFRGLDVLCNHEDGNQVCLGLNRRTVSGVESASKSVP
jgi:hypothetical protein